MKVLGAARMRETYLAVLRPWFGLLTSFYTVMRRGVFDPEDQRRLLRERTEAQLPQTTATATTAR